MDNRRLRVLLHRAKARGDLDTWRRAKAVHGYLSGKRVISMAEQLDVSRVSINRWLEWFDAKGAEGLMPRKGFAQQLAPARRFL